MTTTRTLVALAALTAAPAVLAAADVPVQTASQTVAREVPIAPAVLTNNSSEKIAVTPVQWGYRYRSYRPYYGGWGYRPYYGYRTYYGGPYGYVRPYYRPYVYRYPYVYPYRPYVYGYRYGYYPRYYNYRPVWY
jgi:hypothetical protein